MQLATPGKQDAYQYDHNKQKVLQMHIFICALMSHSCLTDSPTGIKMPNQAPEIIAHLPTLAMHISQKHIREH